MMKQNFFVGVTDHDWFQFCSNQGELEQVNFWQPSTKRFKVLEDGGIFFFKRKSPIGKIAGFGKFAFSGNATIGDCWDAYGVSNGVATCEEFVEKIRKYRRSPGINRFSVIGVKVLLNPIFLKEDDWFDPPTDWSANIVSGKSYDYASDQGAYLFKKYSQLTSNYSIRDEFRGGLAEDQHSYYWGGPTKIRMRQQDFRIAVMDAYDGKCAVTGSGVLEILEAAHIKAYSLSLDHSPSNGILLRKDIHALFDAGLLSFSQSGEVIISADFLSRYPDESEVISLHGKQISFPKDKRNWPSFS